jgi:addiction module HigA family antidote
MHNPPHPGEFIIQVYLDPNNLSGRELAGKLSVAASTLNRILTGTSRISPEMALRLSRRLAVLRRVGLPCSPTTISGKPSSM